MPRPAVATRGHASSRGGLKATAVFHASLPPTFVCRLHTRVRSARPVADCVFLLVRSHQHCCRSRGDISCRGWCSKWSTLTRKPALWVPVGCRLRRSTQKDIRCFKAFYAALSVLKCILLLFVQLNLDYLRNLPITLASTSFPRVFIPEVRAAF